MSLSYCSFKTGWEVIPEPNFLSEWDDRYKTFEDFYRSIGFQRETMIGQLESTAIEIWIRQPQSTLLYSWLLEITIGDSYEQIVGDDAPSMMEVISKMLPLVIVDVLERLESALHRLPQ